MPDGMSISEILRIPRVRGHSSFHPSLQAASPHRTGRGTGWEVAAVYPASATASEVERIRLVNSEQAGTAGLENKYEDCLAPTRNLLVGDGYAVTQYDLCQTAVGRSVWVTARAGMAHSMALSTAQVQFRSSL